MTERIANLSTGHARLFSKTLGGFWNPTAGADLREVANAPNKKGEWINTRL